MPSTTGHAMHHHSGSPPAAASSTASAAGPAAANKLERAPMVEACEQGVRERLEWGAVIYEPCYAWQACELGRQLCLP